MFVYRLCPVSRVCEESAYRTAIHNVTDRLRDDDDDEGRNSICATVSTVD